LLPGAATLDEAGAEGFDFPIWYGVWAPCETVPRIVSRIAEDLASTLAQPDMHEWLIAHDGDPMRMTQSEFARFVRAEIAAARRIHPLPRS
jgi:tripartite-type tricarboxylate transporter receptor subunit TctC